MADNQDIGSDFAGYDDLDPNLTQIGGRLNLLHALARRLSTRRGALGWLGDKDYGFDLRQFVGTSVTASVVEAGAEAECVKDERVLDARVSVSRTVESDGGATLLVDVQITDDRGTFDFTMSVSNLTVTLLDSQ